MKLSKKIWIPLVILGALIVAFAIIFPSIYYTVLRVDLKISAAQIEDDQQVLVKWDTTKPVDKVTIKVLHSGNLVSEEVITNLSDIYDGEKVVDAFYGKMTVEVTINKGIFSTTKKSTVKVFTDEYNIAPLTATMPVTLFSLSLSDITNEGQIPTFVWFKRSGAWNWKNLPENVYGIPVASTSALLGSNEYTMYKETSKWVKELYSINPDSKFHFFYNDYYPYGYVQATFANRLPKENFDVVILSDGTGSFNYFNKHFDAIPEYAQNASEAEIAQAKADAYAKGLAEYEKMANKWEQLKSQIWSKRNYSIFTSAVIGANDLREYAYVMACEEDNVEWWVTRASGTLATNNTEFYDKHVAEQINAGNVVVKDLGTLMRAIPGYGAQEEDTSWKNAYMNVDKIKNLYHFSDDMFEEATKENKKIMIMLGTWTADENAANFDAYVNATMAYYGDDFVYYYKGHPKNPTNSVSGKLEKLQSLGLTDVDSTIAAELLYFFNPNAYFTGFASTTFETVDAEHTCGIINLSKQNGLKDLEGTKDDSPTLSYNDKVDFFMSLAKNSSVNIDGVQFDDDTVLIEFMDTEKYDIAIFNKGTLKFYKLSGSTYTEVER